MASTTAPPEPAPDATIPPPADNRFFSWMRGLDVPRQPGWIGGVCAGIAARLGIDPLIVRGIVVVIAVLGGPVFVLYAAAWLLLPDQKDSIHLEQLFRGKAESPLAGIAALLVLGMLPIAQGFWFVGASYWGEPSWGAALGRAVWTVAMLALLVWFVVWLARRSATPPAAGADIPTPVVDQDGPLTSPATTDDRPDTIPAEPAAPAADASADDLAAWKLQRAQWRAQKLATDRELRDKRVLEQRERARVNAAEYAERRRVYRLANPRAGAAYSAIALGAATLAGGIAAIAWSFPGWEVTVALAVAAITLGLAIVLAGLLRRRSGFLAFVSVLVVIGMLLSAAVPRDRQILWSTSYGLSNAVPGKYAMLTGSLTITLDEELARDGGVIDVWMGSGYADIYIGKDITAELDLVNPTGEIWVVTGQLGDAQYDRLTSQRFVDDRWQSTTTFGPAETPDVTVRLHQEQGGITIHDNSTPTEIQP